LSDELPNAPTKEEIEGAKIIARQDRIPIWALSYLFLGILGIGYIFIFFDIFNINVSFIQTALTLHWATSPTSSTITSLEGLVVLLNLIGYVIGALALSPFSDRFGRREMLIVTLLITGIGSLFNAVVTNYWEFAAARFITGIGVGADLAIVNSYINEVAPKNGRAKYTSFLFVLAGIGTVLAVWVGLILTTPATAFPNGLPFALANTGTFLASNGWRVMYAIGGLLALVGVLLRFGLPESTRWLITHGRPKEADRIVSEMEARALESMEELPPLPESLPIVQKPEPVPYREIFKNKLYRNRTILLFFVWFFGYMTVYINAAGLSTILAGAGFAFPENGIVVALGIFGFVVAGVMAFFLGDKMERKLWLPISAAITFVGGILIAFGISNLGLAAIGALLIFIGMDFFVPITYTWVTESYPTRARATGFAMADGLGHLGGGIGLIIVGALLSIMKSGSVESILVLFIIIAMFQVISAIIAQFGPKTANKRLDEVSP
jgi:MFS family permease